MNKCEVINDFKKEYQKAVSEPFGTHPFWCRFFQRAFASQNSKQLTSAAEVVAKILVAAKDCKAKGNKKVNHSKPRKQDIEKAECKIQNCPYP